MRNRLEIQRLASTLREQLGADLSAPVDIFSLVTSDSNLTVVYYPFSDQISGICIKSANLIAINSKSTKGRQNFSLAHELYHYYFDHSEDSEVSIVDTTSASQKSNVEKEADLFASHFLIPDQTLNRMVNSMTKNFNESLTLRNIVEIEQYFRVSRHALLSRLIIDKYITIEESDEYRKDVIEKARLLGFDDSLYRPSPVKNEKMTVGAYIPKAADLKANGIISQGKYEEFLLDAFREDLVFGVDEDEYYD